MPGSDRASGASNIDHPNGSTAMGNEYAYSGQNCEVEYGQSGNGTFTWSISHSNVNTVSEFGTEHGIAMLSTDANKAAGFNGRITNYDFKSQPDTCGNRDIYYTSGHQFDTGTCSPSAPGNFNTHGGAATGDHFNGKYGTVVYQDNNNNLNSPCQSGSQNYCFQAILIGRTN